MLRYKLKEEVSPKSSFQKERIGAFDEILITINSLRSDIQKAKQDTIKHYQENPEDFNVLYSTDIIKDYLKDIKILLEP